MKKIILIAILAAMALIVVPLVFAQTDSQIQLEEAAGKAVYDKLQSEQISCSDLSDDDFELLGDYYMGQMMGSSHSAMDNLMTQRIGENNNRLMHITLGNRLSGCDTSASFPSQGTGFLLMMGMMGQNWSYIDNYNQSNGFGSMMGNYFGWPTMMSGWYGGFGWIFMILFWVLVILAIVALIRWAAGRSKNGFEKQEKSAFDILKERYAKGEINKEEFEEKKKDLN